MENIFSRYLSVGSDSAIPENLARTPSLVLGSGRTHDDSLASGSELSQHGSLPPPPHKGDALQDATNKDAHVLQGSTQIAEIFEASGSPATNQEPDDVAVKDLDVPTASRQPSPNASLQHLHLSSNQIPPPASSPRPTSGPWQLFGIPLGSTACPQLHQQSSSSEPVSLPSSVPLRYYSETNADSLTKRLCPVYKRDNNAKRGRKRFLTYAACTALLLLSMSVLVLLAFITSLWRRPVQTAKPVVLSDKLVAGNTSSTTRPRDGSMAATYATRPPNDSRVTGSLSAASTTGTTTIPPRFVTV